MFGGFKATLSMLGGKKTNGISELSPDMFLTGAYRVNKEDFYGYSTQDPPKSRRSKQAQPPLRQTKSTSDLLQPKITNPNLRNSTSAISQDPRGAEQTDRNSIPSRKEIKYQEKEQKKIEKKRLADQKKQAQEQAKQEKLMKERAKKEAQKVKSEKNKKTQAPTPPPPPCQAEAEPKIRPQTKTQPQPQAKPQPQPQTKSQPPPQAKPQPQPQTKPQPQTSIPVPPPQAYSTNTLDSSISRTSGPPPYSEVPKPQAPQGSNGKGNVLYKKPVDTGSWDIISQHREQIKRPAAAVSAEGKRKQMVMDLNYSFGATSGSKENSDA